MILRRIFPVLSVVAACTMSGAAFAADAAPSRAADPATVKRMDKKLSDMSTKGVALADCIDFLRDVSGVNIAVDWNALSTAGVSKDMPITADIHNQPMAKVVKTFLDAAKGNLPLDYAVQNNVLVISTADALKTQPPLRPSAAKTDANDAVQKALDTPVYCNLDKETLRSALRKLLADETVTVDWSALKANGVTPDTSILELKARKAPVRELLSIMLLDAGAGHQPLDFVVRDGQVYITTQAKLDKTE